MKRLRNKILLVLLFLVTSGLLGTALMTAHIFTQDKRDYVMDLQSAAAQSIALAIGKNFAQLLDQLTVLNDILGRSQGSKSNELIELAFRKLRGVEHVAAFDERGLVASIGKTAVTPAALHPWNQSAASRMLGKFEISVSTDSSLILSTVIGDRLYQLDLARNFFDEYFAFARAFTAFLVDSNGVLVTGTTSVALSPRLVHLVHRAADQAVIARQIIEPDGTEQLAAVAPVHRSAVLVVVQAPGAMVPAMVAQVIRRSHIFVAAILIVTVFVAIAFSSRLTRPVEELTEATSQIASGNWYIPVSAKTNDEIGRLVAAFKKMGAALSARDKELKAANDLLVRNERLAVLGKFSAGIAHEVKNPLNSILGYGQLLQRQNWGDTSPKSEETSKKYIGFILDETRRASKIIGELLMFARQKPPTLTPTPVPGLIQYAHDLLSPQASAAGIQLETEIQTPELQANVDKDQMFQVLSNLVGNAIHALEENNSREKKIIIRARSEGEDAVIEVADTGCGISAENISKIFEPFFSTKQVGKGTGLGLSLCLGIVQQHSGRIEVRSEINQGTTFAVYLPALPRSES